MTNPKAEPVGVTPLVHPAAILRGRWEIEEAQETYLTRTSKTVKVQGAPPQWDVSQPPEGAWLFPTIPQLWQWWDEVREGGFDAVVHDLETAGDHIICDGLAGLNLDTGQLGRVLCLRFRVREGKRYWSSRLDHDAAVEFLSEVLDDPTRANVFHNGVGFDLQLLVRHGFRTQGPILDTMVMSSRAYAEMPKGLQFLATRYLWAPVWKTLTDTDDEAEGKG